MAETQEENQRLSEYSTRTNVNAMNIALVDQRVTILEKQTDGYHLRLHNVEDDMLVVKTKQEIHDVQIQGMRKVLVGNGDRETIPMDLQRMEQNIANILKVDWNKAQAELDAIKKWQEGFDKKVMLIWGSIAVLVLNRIWEWFVP